ncbi:MAG: oligopeptide ABC transporter permease [Bacillaceae bacterium]
MNNLKENQIPAQLFQPANKSLTDNEVIQRPSLNFWQDAGRRLFKNKGAIMGLVFIIIIMFFAAFGPMMTDYKYSDQNLKHAKLPPKIEALSFIPGFDGTDRNGVDQYKARNVDAEYWFGTDDLGRDLFTRVWSGTRVSLAIGLLAAAFDLVIGVAYGGISGFYGGRTDTIMQRIAEILQGIPYLILVMLFILIFKNPGILSIALAMGVTGWIGMSRMVRGQVLKLKNQEFVLASRTLGASSTKLIAQHMVPNVMGSIIIMIMMTIPAAIFAEAFLSFIGLGIAPPSASLGSLVNDGFKSIQTYPHMLFIPAVVISLLVLSFNLLADGLRDAFDPRMRK